MKKAIKVGNADTARVFTANVICQWTQCANFLCMSSRVEAIASRVEMACKMNTVTKTMGSIVNSMTKGLGGMNMERIFATMEKLDKAFDDMDVHSAVMEKAMGGAAASVTPQGEVDSLITQVANAHTLNVDFMLPRTGTSQPRPVSTRISSSPPEEDTLMQRLAELRT